MQNNIFQNGFNFNLAKPRLLPPTAAGRSNFYNGVDPTKVGFNDPFFQKTKVGSSTFSVRPGESIQDRINEAKDKGGGIIYLDAGTFYLDKDILLYSNITLRGAGNFATIIDFGGGSYSLKIIGTDTYSTGTVAVTMDSTTVTGTGTTWTSAMVGRSMLIDGDWYTISAFVSTTELTLASGFSGTTQSGLSYEMATINIGARLERLTVQNSSGSIVKLQHTYSVVMEDIALYTGDIGFDIQDSVFFIIRNMESSDCATGLYLDNAFSYLLTSFFIYDCTGNGFQSDSGGDATTFDFGVSNCGGDGIRLTSTSKVSFISFTVDSNTSQGIELVSLCDDNSFNSGSVHDNVSDGIKLTATSDRNSFAQLQLVDNGGYGINIAASTCDNNVVVGNVFSGNTTAPANNSGMTTIVNDNIGFGAQAASTALDNFYMRTFTNTPNPNWEIGVGDGAGALDTAKAFIFGISNKLGINTKVPETLLSIAGDSNGSQAGIHSATELLTVAAASSTTTSANLLPAGVIVLAVTCRVTVAIPTAATFVLTSATDAVAFTGNVAVAAGTTSLGTTHWAATTSKLSTAAQAITLTPNLTPATNAGRVRITTYYFLPTPSTS